MSPMADCHQMSQSTPEPPQPAATPVVTPVATPADYLGSLAIAAAAACLVASFKWAVPGAAVPGWLPSGVFLGLLFINPMRSIRRGKPCMRCALRFSTGLGVAALIHVLAYLILEGAAGEALFPFLLPLLLVPLFVRPGPSRFTQLLGGKSSLKSFFRRARG